MKTPNDLGRYFYQKYSSFFKLYREEEKHLPDEKKQLQYSKSKLIEFITLNVIFDILALGCFISIFGIWFCAFNILLKIILFLVFIVFTAFLSALCWTSWHDVSHILLERNLKGK